MTNSTDAVVHALSTISTQLPVLASSSTHDVAAALRTLASLASTAAEVVAARHEQHRALVSACHDLESELSAAKRRIAELDGFLSLDRSLDRGAWDTTFSPLSPTITSVIRPMACRLCHTQPRRDGHSTCGQCDVPCSCERCRTRRDRNV